ncbi:MAG: DNA/RNA non-specific endonuclease [Rikenellaceae bacterium]
MKKRDKLAVLRLFVLSILVGVSCSAAETSIDTTNDTSTTIEQSAKLRLSKVSSSAVVAIVEYTSSVNTAWSATIDDDEFQFVSFDYADLQTTAEGVIEGSSKSHLLYLYLKENTTSVNRTASIIFRFEGRETAFVLELTQLLQEEDSTAPYTSSGDPLWAEVPSLSTDLSKGYIYVYHTTTTADGDKVRNFSLCFDPSNHAAAWVAYPLHDIYDGDVGRNEDWEYDPLIPTELQPNLNSSYVGDYDRGHQIASADRQATVEMNKQTFYFSNMTPQLDKLNQGVWATLESRVRDQICSDTLYVVTGADFTSSIGSTTDRDGMVSPLPGAYYKVILRTRSGVSGKGVGECTADELKAVGFWYEHRSYSSLATPISVAEIEERIGFTLFTTIPQQVKASYDPSLWSF